MRVSKYKERHMSGEENINPRLTLKQKPDVELSEEKELWIEEKILMES
jgi:hypothetical protein